MESTGGQALVAALRQHRVEDIFFIPGIQLDWAVDALRQEAGITRYVPRHEQSTTYMADGYYRASGKPGVAMVVPGPGVLNAGAGLSTAYASNSKVLLLAGQVHSQAIGKAYGQLHEIKDQTGLIQGLTKWNSRVMERSQISAAIDQAFVALHEGRPRPTAVEIPYDLLIAKGEDATGQATAAKNVPPPEPQAIQQAVEMIEHARFPIIYVGGGISSSDGMDALRVLAERLGAPVVMSDNGRGALSDRHPLAMNSLAGRPLFEAADLVLVIGSRFMDAMTPSPSWPNDGDLRYIYINIDAADLTAPRRPELAIQADARATLEALTQSVSPRQVLTERQAEKVRRWAQVQIDAVSPQADYIAAMREALPEDGVFVNELTQVGYLARIAFPVYSPHTYIGPGYQGTLGYALPTALGAAVGAGGNRVLVITGDGGLGWSYQELATARKYNLPVTLVVFNDGHYGNVRAIQRRVFGAEVAVDLENPDFPLLAKAFGIPSLTVDKPSALKAAIIDSLDEPGPVLIEVPLGEVPSPWHLLRLQPMPGVEIPNTPPNPLKES